MARLLFAALAVAASLIAFPSALAWMIGFWLLWFSFAAAGGRVAVVPLVVLVLIVAAKGVEHSAAAIVLAALAVTIALWRLVSIRTSKVRQRRWATPLQIAACWVAWTALVLDGHFAVRSSRNPDFNPTRPIICLGDSLTAYGFPEVLADNVAAPVVNGGRDGITTADALKRLPSLLAARPQVVIVELGGHDYLKGHGREPTRINLEKIITACRAQAAEVVLFEIPRGLVYDPFHGLERELARTHDLELVSDTPIRCLVLWSPYGPPGMWLPRSHHLSEDGLHPNAAGNDLLAKYVADAMERQYGLKARRQ